MAEDKKTLYCSFCGKSQHDVHKLIAGPSCFICNECSVLCLGIILEERDGPIITLLEFLVMKKHDAPLLEALGIDASELLNRAIGVTLSGANENMTVPEFLGSIEVATKELLPQSLRAILLEKELQPLQQQLDQMRAEFENKSAEVRAKIVDLQKQYREAQPQSPLS